MNLGWKEKQTIRDQLITNFILEISQAEIPCKLVEEIPSLMQEKLSRIVEQQTGRLIFKVDQDYCGDLII